MKKFVKKAIGLLAALSIMFSATTTAYANDVEIHGEGTESKSQTIEVTASIASVYAVTMPATLELNYETITKSEPDGSNEVTYNGYFCDIEIGAAGKILSTQKLKMSLENNSNIMTGANTGRTVQLKTLVSTYSNMYGAHGGYLFAFDAYNSVCNDLQWDVNTIGTCSYDGVTLTNCNYTYRTLTIGFHESDVSAADIYSGNIVINFGLE